MDGNDAFTKLLLHCDGADASTTFLDASNVPKSVIPSGNAQVDTAQSVFGGASLLLDGSGDYVGLVDDADWNLGAGNFVVDFRLRPAVLGAVDRTLFFQGPSGADFIHLLLDSSSRISFIVRSGGFDVGAYTATHNLSINTWYHIALVRSGTSIFIFKDGVAYSLTATTAIGSSSIPDFAAALTFGDNTVSPLPFNGWFDEIRWSKGTDRGWTSNFTPPAAAYQFDLDVAAGAFAETGQAAVFRTPMAEGTGAFAESGKAAAFASGLAGGVGASALSGKSAPLNHAVQFGAGAPGSYLLSGKPVILHPALTLTNTDKLQLPVDYALAGGQRYPVRAGRLR